MAIIKIRIEIGKQVDGWLVLLMVMLKEILF
jgi:hypothetical protein